METDAEVDDDPLAAWRKLVGAGARLGFQRSVEEIDADIREMRADRTVWPKE
jgi:hypothetical protein